MGRPAPPRNVRIVYPDGTEIPVPAVEYRGVVDGQHVWQAMTADGEMLWVPGDPGARPEFDGGDGPAYVFVGYDLPGRNPVVEPD